MRFQWIITIDATGDNADLRAAVECALRGALEDEAMAEDEDNVLRYASIKLEDYYETL